LTTLTFHDAAEITGQGPISPALRARIATCAMTEDVEVFHAALAAKLSELASAFPRQARFDAGFIFQSFAEVAADCFDDVEVGALVAIGGGR